MYAWIYYIIVIYRAYITVISMLAFQGVVPFINQPTRQWTASVLLLSSCLATSGRKAQAAGPNRRRQTSTESVDFERLIMFGNVEQKIMTMNHAIWGFWILKQLKLFVFVDLRVLQTDSSSVL